LPEPMLRLVIAVADESCTKRQKIYLAEAGYKAITK